jgi:hypothetical protein
VNVNVEGDYACPGFLAVRRLLDIAGTDNDLLPKMLFDRCVI